MAAPKPMPLEEIERHFTPPPAPASGNGAAFDPRSAADLPDLSPVEIPLEIAGRRYLLREASEAAFLVWRGEIFRATRPDADGKPTTMEGAQETTSLLVSLCLFEADGRTPVSLGAVRQLPTRVVGALFTKIQKVSGLETEVSAPLPEAAAPPPEPPPPADPEAPRTAGHSTRTMWGD